MKKRKLLVLTPLLALTLSGCFARSPLPATSGQSTSGSGSTTSTSSEPEETTYGTMDAPITVARAVEIAKEQYSDLKAKSFVDKDAYVKGVLKNNPIKSKDTDEYRFTVGDSFEATTTLDFYYGSVGEGVTMPVQGDSVIMLGRLLDVDGGTTIRLAGSESEQVADPVVKKTDHMTYTLTLEKTGEATVTGLPTSAKSGDKVEFTVAPGTGYDIDEVLIDGIYDYAADNKYSFTVGHNTKVTVTAVQGLVKSDLRKAYESALVLETGSVTEEKITFKGTVVLIAGNSYFLQDGKYGMYIYNKETEGIAVGKEVTVTAYLQKYNNGVLETWSDKDKAETAVQAAVTGYGTMPVAGEVTSLKSLNTLRQNVLANAKNVKFISKDKEWSGSNNSIAKFDLNGETLTVKFDKYAFKNADSEDKTKINSAKEGDVVSLYSLVTTVNYDSPQLVFGSTSSFTKEVTPVVKPTTVTVTPATKEIHLDQKDVTLTATVGPEGADVKTVTWSSSHPAICDVNATTGLLDPKAISDTVVTITATSTANPDAKGTCAVTVTRVPVTSVAITETGPINLAVGGATATLHTTVLPANATDDSLDWSVSPATGVVSVANGVVTPVGEGTATVTVASHSDPDKTASIVFNVGTDAKHVESVTFDPTAKTIKIGDTFDLKTIVTVLPADATNKNLTWESSSTAVTVNDGVIEGKAVTTSPVTITATSQDVTTVKGEIAITVEKIAVTKIELNKDELAMTVGGDDETLTVTVTPDNATEQGVTWSSSNPDAATVSDAGVVHAVAAGTAIITATSKDNADIKDICTVSVSAAPSTHGTFDNPLTVAEARVIAVGLESTSGTIYDTVDAYVRGVVKGNPTESSGQYKFFMGDTIDDQNDIQFFYGNLGTGITEPPIKGETVVVKGRLADYFSSNKHTYELAGNDGQSIPRPEILKIEPVTPTSIDLTNCPATVAVDNKITLTGVIGPVGARGTIAWSIKSGDSYATLSGNELTGVAGGTVVVTAKLAENETITADKTITVTSDAPKTSTITITPSDGEAVDGGTTGKPFTITKDSFTITANGTLTATEARIFKNKTMTISGATITKVVITCTANGTAKQGPGCWGAGAPEGYTFEADGKVGTWEGETTSLSFTASDNQVRIVSFVITYIVE